MTLLAALTIVRNLKFDLQDGHHLTDEDLRHLARLRLTALSLPQLDKVCLGCCRLHYVCQLANGSAASRQGAQLHEFRRHARTPVLSIDDTSQEPRAADRIRKKAEVSMVCALLNSKE